MTSTSAPICFVDTETTDIGHRRLAWEMAVIRRDPDGTRRETQAFIEVDLSDANPFALNVGRFYDRHPLGRWLADGVSEETMDEIMHGPREAGIRPDFLTAEQAAAAWCRWTHGAHVIGAVPNFDTEVMGTAAHAAGLLTSHHYHLADIENLITGWVRGRLTFDTSLAPDERTRLEKLATPPWSSDDLLAELGVTTPEGERHTALGDARTAERAWMRLYGPKGQVAR